MKLQNPSIMQLVEEQVRKWQILNRSEKERHQDRAVITVSREPGSGGRLVAQEIAERLDWDLYHQEVTSWSIL